eukprot:UN25301
MTLIQSIESLILNDHKTCTAKWFSLHNNTNITEVRAAFSEIEKTHQNELTSHYSIFGVDKDNNRRMLVVDSNNLENEKALFSSVLSCGIYSLGPKSNSTETSLIDLSDSMDTNIRQNRLPFNQDLSTISNPVVSRRTDSPGRNTVRSTSSNSKPTTAKKEVTNNKFNFGKSKKAATTNKFNFGKKDKKPEKQSTFSFGKQKSKTKNTGKLNFGKTKSAPTAKDTNKEDDEKNIFGQSVKKTQEVAKTIKNDHVKSTTKPNNVGKTKPKNPLMAAFARGKKNTSNKSSKITVNKKSAKATFEKKTKKAVTSKTKKKATKSSQDNKKSMILNVDDESSGEENEEDQNQNENLFSSGDEEEMQIKSQPNSGKKGKKRKRKVIGEDEKEDQDDSPAKRLSQREQKKIDKQAAEEAHKKLLKSRKA